MESNSKVTQRIDRRSLGVGGGDSLFSITTLIQNGEEIRRIYSAIVECATNTPGVHAAAIYLPNDRNERTRELVAKFGAFDFSPSIDADASQVERHIVHEGMPSAHAAGVPSLQAFDIICLGAPIGALTVVAPEALEREPREKLSLLAHHTAVAFERQRLSATLQHFVDRLEVLNELNQLIAANVGLGRIVKSIARESAFRFAADVALTFLLAEDKETLEVKGGYGCSQNLLPESYPTQDTLMGQVLRLGGHLSVANLGNHANHGLTFLDTLGIRAVDICCLEVRGETLGVLLIGFRREAVLSTRDATRFEEFCQGAAVAIANARTQERIASYTERLEELVAQRTADLAVQTSRAEEANRAKSQFLANMSHELRTPLTAIVGYASVLADGIFGPVTDKQRDALNAVVKSSEHLKTLIDDVLNLARIESGKEVPEPKPVPVKEVLTSTHKLILQQAINKGVKLAPLALDEALAETAIFVDAKHLHQILINLMSNAIKYTPAGGKIWVEASIIVDKVRISVHDTGVGLSPQKLARLFERFERGEDAYSRSQEGTGIGLNLTKHLVELNGGRIGVESTEQKGSTFWVALPIASSSQTAITPVESKDVGQIRLEGLTAVVVDDNPDTCEVLRHILMNAGATVRTAQSVPVGMALVQESVPDIILTDLAIPEESGLSFIQRVRSDVEPLARTPILVLSACAFAADRDAALNAGAEAFLPKPFRPADVLQHVRQLTLNTAMEGRAFPQEEK